jgi:hypothetical protein
MEFWFKKKNNGVKDYNSKLISINFIPKHFKTFSSKTNGAIKGVDKCFDYNLCFYGLMFSYTNFDYND